jgi:hypothetical protein
VGVRALGDQALAGGGDGGEVDVVPVDGGWRGQALESSVEADTQVEPNGVGVAGQEVRGDLVQLLGSEGDAEDEVGFDAELAEVVVDGADDLVGRGVAKDGIGPASGVKAGSVTAIGRPFLVVTSHPSFSVAEVVGITRFG